MKNSGYTEHRTGYIFLLIFILLSASIVTGGFFVYRNYEKNYRTEVEQQLSAVAELKVNQLVRWRKERLGDGQLFYKNDSFSAIVRRCVQNKNDRDAKTGILAWVGQIQRINNYDLTMLLDAQLNTILVYPENKERPHLIIDERNTGILLSGNIAFQDFYRDEHDRHIYLMILVPILEDLSSKRLIGLLALRISPEEYLYPIIKKWPTPSRTAETLLIRKDGNDALFLNDLKFRNDAAMNLRIPLTRKDVLAVQAALGTEGIVEAIDYRGEPVIGYVCPVANSPWFIVARMDISEVYAPLRERLWLILILIVGFIGGAGSSVGFVWRHQSSRFYRDQFKSSEALRDSENRYRRLFETARDGILILDADTGMIVDVNPFLIEMLGFSHEVILEKKIWELGFFKDIIANQEKFLELQLKEYIRYEDLPLETINGKKINVEFVSNVYLVDHHKVIQCNIRDITERKRAEEALRESEDKFKYVFDKSLIGKSITLPSGKINSNKALCDMLGYSNEELNKLNWQEITHPDDIDLTQNALQLLVSGEKESVRFIKRYLHKNGSIVWGDIGTALRRDNVGNPLYFMTFVNDITERKHVEDALSESQSLYHSFIEQLPNAVFRKDCEGRYVLVNHQFCKLKGVKKEDFIGRKPMEVAAGEIAAQGREGQATKYANVGEDVHEKILKTGKIFETEEEYPSTNGGIQYMNVVRMPVFDSHRTIIGTQGIMFDVSERKRFEDKLKTSELMYRRLFEAARDGILILDSDTGMVVDVNPFLIEMLGYSREQFFGKSIWELGFFKDIAANKLNFKVLQQKEFIRYENMPLETADGRLINVEFVSYVYQVDHHNVIQCNIRDITERIRVEETVKSAKAFLDTVVDLSPFAMWISDDKGTLIRANQSLCDTINLRDDEIIGKYNVLKDVNLDIQGVMPMVRAVFEKHDPARFSIPWKSADAGDVDFKGGRDMFIDVSMYPILNAQSELTNVVCQWLDITERKRAEGALRENEALLQTVINILPVGLWVFDAEGKIVISSAAAQRIWAGVRYIGIDQLGEYKGWRTDSGKLIEAHEWAGARALEKGETTIEEEVEIECFDGTHKIIVDSGVPLRKSDGSICGAVTINHDITVRKKAEEEILKLNAELEQRVLKRTSQLESANKELEAFSYSVSHDLRAPLRHVNGYVELLDKNFQTELTEKGRHYLDAITDSVHKMGVLIDDLLKFSKTGRVEMHESVLDMNRIVVEVSERLRLENPQRSIEWTIAQLPSIQGDKAMLQLVWENLLSNAVKFTHKRKNAKIEIGFREEDKEFVFFIHDNGAGFDMQYAQKLFGVFQRLHSAAEFEGTGVGLANVHRIITRHGGRTWAEAELDKGATFYFSIPI